MLTLCRTLKHFKLYDQVLREVYNYKGASYNFSLLRDVAHTLIKLVDGAQAVAEESASVNAIVSQFDVEALDLLQSVQEELSNIIFIFNVGACDPPRRSSSGTFRGTDPA